MGSIGVHGHGATSCNLSVADQGALVIVPEEFDLLLALVLECHEHWLVPRVRCILLVNVNDPFVVCLFRHIDLFSINIDFDCSIVDSFGNPWVSGVGVHEFRISRFNGSVADLLS